MATVQIDPDTVDYLARRIGHVHLKQRLGIETAYEAKVFGQGRNWFHIENIDSLDSVIRGLLKLTMLHRRGQRNARRIVVRQHEFRAPHLPRAFDGYTLLHITDLHLDMAADMADTLIDAISSLDYDVCVLTGDYRAQTFGTLQPAIDALTKVRKHLKGQVVAVLGNHDSIRMVPQLEKAGIAVLLNESLALHADGNNGGPPIWLAGVDDPHYFRADNLEKAADDIPEDAYSILLAHSPEIYKNAAHAGFDVMLCGHTHGGQICLPGGRPVMVNARCPRYLCAGAWQYRALSGYTSAGSGACVVDIRFNCPPEVVLHTLKVAR